jgi:hypothetical protein
MQMKPKKLRYSQIAAVIHVSESEVVLVHSDYESSWNNPCNPNHLKLVSTLRGLGLSTNFPYEYQQVSQHRNRLGQVVVCSRWFGDEREDSEWVNSKYSSQAAKDKAKRSEFLDDLYRQKGLTTDAQVAMEIKDSYNKKEEEDYYD